MKSDAAAAGGATMEVKDWVGVPTQDDIDALIAKVNDDSNPYADYRPSAPAQHRGQYELPGKAILTFMNDSVAFNKSVNDDADPSSCLNTGFNPTHWSDLQLHMYCIVNTPRYCYTAAVAPVSSPVGKGLFLSRRDAYKGCSELSDDFKTRLAGTAGFLNDTTSPRFKAWMDFTKGNLLFQYIMFAQTYAFNPAEEQAIINAHYGVTDPTDKSECKQKRPRRAEDPDDGTHCLPTKTWVTQRTKSTTLEGVGR